VAVQETIDPGPTKLREVRRLGIWEGHSSFKAVFYGESRNHRVDSHFWINEGAYGMVIADPTGLLSAGSEGREIVVLGVVRRGNAPGRNRTKGTSLLGTSVQARACIRLRTDPWGPSRGREASELGEVPRSPYLVTEKMA